jgi:hypothetical protein
VAAPFGSGCLQLLPELEDAGPARAQIGGTDVTVRRYLPKDTLAFTVNRPMLRRLCALDEKSFLHKHAWRDLRAARGRA